MGCEKEQKSCHYGAPERGHGPVQEGETILAGFCATDLADGKLLKQAFPGKKLKDGDFSIARLAFTTKEIFNEYVVERRKNSVPVVGVGRASVRVLRQLTAPLDWQNPVRDIRAICVLDRVENGEHDGHAALEFCEEQKEIVKQKRLERVRAHIAADLVTAFGDVLTLDNAFG